MLSGALGSLLWLLYIAWVGEDRSSTVIRLQGRYRRGPRVAWTDQGVAARRDGEKRARRAPRHPL